MIKFFYIPIEVWYYILISVFLILLIYITFSFFYRKKKGTYYYNYVVDYVYSSLGILFCSLLLCLLLGYSIATIKVLNMAEMLEENVILAMVLVILPIIPFCFLLYVAKIYIINLKRKVQLDEALESREKEEIELVKKNS